MSRYVVANIPTPLFSSPDFLSLLGEKKLPLEMVALPETKFSIIAEISKTLLKAETTDYPNKSVYLDLRFTREASENTPERKKILPSREEILQKLQEAIGLPYIWGGNCSAGIPDLPLLYEEFSLLMGGVQTLRGLDCSGLLYEACSGWTPRNTSELFIFGKEIASYKDPFEKMLQNVKPLDILVWPGHVIIIYNRETAIESLEGKGVLFSPLETRIASIQSNTPFSVRRIFP